LVIWWDWIEDMEQGVGGESKWASTTVVGMSVGIFMEEALRTSCAIRWRKEAHERSWCLATTVILSLMINNIFRQIEGKWWANRGQILNMFMIK
jgi:hypothetical protein